MRPGILRWTTGARAECALAPTGPILERELQAQLHHAGVSRTDDRAAGYEVRCAAPAAESLGN